MNIFRDFLGEQRPRINSVENAVCRCAEQRNENFSFRKRKKRFFFFVPKFSFDAARLIYPTVFRDEFRARRTGKQVQNDSGVDHSADRSERQTGFASRITKNLRRKKSFLRFRRAKQNRRQTFFSPEIVVELRENAPKNPKL